MPDIIFEKNPETNRLNVSIKTERLVMESTIPNHLCNYKKLFMDSENMLKVKFPSAPVGVIQPGM